MSGVNSSIETQYSSGSLRALGRQRKLPCSVDLGFVDAILTSFDKTIATYTLSLVLGRDSLHYVPDGA